MSHRPVVILTALDLEYQAIRDKLTDLRPRRHPQGTRFEIGRHANGRCQVALAHVGKGNHAAAVLAERAINEFAPAALLFVGVAGALHSHISLGDLVVATHVYAFHGGTSEDDAFKGRPRVWETAHAADQIARHVDRGRSWLGGLPDGDRRPQVYFGPIAAGEVVLNSRISAHARWLNEHYNDALAIEMEGAGVAQAGHLNRSLPVVVVRGISDRADGTKQATDREQWQPRAAANAAAFAVVLAEELTADEQDGGLPMEAELTRSLTVHETTRNIATGNARVGVQAGTVHGDIRITMDPAPPSVPAQEES
ncbi:5'-methylthioadenosine/S-adenosylhomocysteine nucleosidase [Acrocarpospora catenulata]|uniref:5'-methylthioadenosine/S-adenosylhomocysteine nucleosidase n=1 Tax=Acrocarpospora catenulata TaxID=2836182 RepID=UPI001BDAE620|nr:5'-methylthioadenosine/S-adenosylhomocysteine nucleosidase [Acrocarpospora catenulata]